MATSRIERKLAAVIQDNSEEYPRNNSSRYPIAPKIREDYITPFPEEFEGRVTKKVSPDLSRVKIRILGALSILDEFLLHSQVRVQSRTVQRKPET